MRRRFLLLVAGVTAVAAAVVALPAYSADDQPPVTVADEVTLLPGGSTTVDVMANDSDDFSQQALCRARGNDDAEATVDSGEVFVNVPTDQAGDYQVQYQACDYDYLSVGTLTVHAVAPQAVKVHKVAGEPGVLHATNPNPVRVVVFWAGAKSQRLEGHLGVPAGGEKDFTVTHPHIFWAAIDPSSYWEDGSIVGYGEVRHIEIPASTRPTPSSVGPRWTALWRAARSGRALQPHHVRRVAAAAPWPSDPTAVQPPVPKADTIHWWSGSWDRVAVTRNDTDPAGHDVDVCRLAPEATAPSLRHRLIPSVLDGRLDVGTTNRATGTVLLPYYVCNNGRLAPAVLRVVLRRAARLQVVRLRSDPRLVKVHNPNPARVDLEVGSSYASLFVGRIKAHQTRTFHVPATYHLWRGYIGRHYGSAGSGHLRLG
jgi:hypothetical protein